MEHLELTQEEATHKLAVSASMVLEHWPLDDLLSFNLGVLLYGRIARENRSFKPAVEASLCDQNGNLWDREALEMAIQAEMARRDFIKKA